MNNFVNYDGELTEKNDNLLNRSFLYGDGLFETIHALGCSAQFLADHIERLLDSMQIICIDIPSSFTEKFFAYEIERLLKRNKQFKGTRVRITVFRKSGGTGYNPSSNKPNFIIQTEQLENDTFELNKKGKTMGIYLQQKKQTQAESKLSNLKTTNSLFYILAAIEKSSMNLDDLVILNSKNNIVETINSNIFIIKNEKIFTPPLSSGCVNGIMRKQIFKIAKNINYPIVEHELTEADLLQADELFTTNAIKGINYFVAFKNKRYFNKTSKKLIIELNKLAFS